jgi:lipopolysaccharide transport system permease protein
LPPRRTKRFNHTVSQSASPSVLLLLSPWHIVANLWRHRDLVWQFTMREIHIRHKGSRLGIVWALLNPLSMLVLYAFVFRLLFRSKFGVIPNETDYDYTLELFLSLSLFHVFAETLSWAPSLIISHPNFVKKVVFPLEVLPVAKIGDTTFHLLVSLALVLIGSAFGSSGLSWSMLWLPVLVLPLLVLALGMAWAFAAIGVFVRDVSQVIGFVATAVMFGSAIMYPPRMIPDSIYSFLRFNPLLQLVDVSRHVLFGHEPVDWMKLGYVYGCAVLALLAGHVFFSLLRRSFAEVI